MPIADVDRQIAFYRIYLKVFVEYAADRRCYSDGATLPTTVFFELNGRPRSMRVGDARQIGAPMPDIVEDVRVSVGKTVARGEVVLTLEAMKLQISVHAERGGTGAEVLIQRGAQVEEEDLPVVRQ